MYAAIALLQEALRQPVSRDQLTSAREILKLECARIRHRLASVLN